MKKPAKIIFMGTASFAVPSLDMLHSSGHEIAAVITAPDKPAGRGKKIRHSPVKAYALDHNLTLLQPESLKDPELIASLTGLKPDLSVVVAFRMLPEAVWRIPVLGTINLHASLLPQFRGAAPINHAIMQGHLKTGVTTFYIDDKIDTGNILKQAETAIGKEETAGALHDRLMDMGAKLVLATVEELLEGTLHPVPQDSLIGTDTRLLAAPKIFKEDCRISWDRDANTLYNFIRGLSPLPGAYTSLDFSDGSHKTVKIFKAHKIEGSPKPHPGTLRIEKNSLEVACKNGYLSITELQLEGKRKMHIEEFLRGFNAKSIIGMGLL